MVLQTNTMTLGKLVIKCPLKPREDLQKSSLSFRGHLITNFPNVMVLLIIIRSHNVYVMFIHNTGWSLGEKWQYLCKPSSMVRIDINFRI